MVGGSGTWELKDLKEKVVEVSSEKEAGGVTWVVFV